MAPAQAFDQTEVHAMLNVFYYATGIPVEYIDGRRAQTLTRLPEKEYLYLPISDAQPIQRQALQAAMNAQPLTYVALEDEYYQQYLATGVWQEEKWEGCLLAGPVQVDQMTHEKWTHILLHTSLSLKEQKQLRAHYKQIPQLSFHRLKYLGVLLQNLHHMHLQPIKPAASPHKSMRVEKEVSAILHEPANDPYPYEWEGAFLEALQNGDRTVLKQLASFDQYPVPSIGNGDPVRAYKNLLICAVAVAVRAVAKNGVDFERLQNFSNDFINQIEATYQIPRLTNMYYGLFEQLFDMIDEHDATQYVRSIHACIHYIRQHLSSPLTLQEMAEHIDLHSRYLAALFKKETGMTVFTYIARERVAVAKRLLQYTSEPIIMIANDVGYSNQSYFTQLFKKHEGLTPKQYRDKC